MRGLVEGYFQLRVLGPTRIKGVIEPVELFEVTGWDHCGHAYSERPHGA
jgi:hypothetical protein